MQVGDRIRVKASVMVYHHPEHRNQPFDLKGQTGEIMTIVESWRGRAVSPNLPVQVQFDKRFMAHFLDNELEPIEGPVSE